MGLTVANSGFERPAAPNLLPASPAALRTLLLEAPQTTPTTSVVRAYNYHDLAFFCKVEVDLERESKLQYRFRLGSTEYVNYLEGKE